MQVPKDRKDLERYLGAVNFLSKFIPNPPNRSKIAVPMTNLIKKIIRGVGEIANASHSTT